MLITTLLNAVSLTTAAEASNTVKVTLSATTTALTIHAQILNAASEQYQVVEVLFAVSPFSILATDAPVQLVRQAEVLKVLNSKNPGSLTISKSELMVADGSYLYMWLRNAAMTAGTTLSVSVAEFN